MNQLGIQAHIDCPGSTFCFRRSGQRFQSFHEAKLNCSLNNRSILSLDILTEIANNGCQTRVLEHVFDYIGVEGPLWFNNPTIPEYQWITGWHRCALAFNLPQPSLTILYHCYMFNY